MASRGRWGARIPVVAIVLLGLLLAACASQGSPSKSSARETGENLGRGGGGPNWNTTSTGGAAAAIAWAESFQHGQPNFAFSQVYSGYCLAFVANAYGASSSWPFETAWDLGKASHLHDPTNPAAAPVGALIFFGPNYYNKGDGH